MAKALTKRGETFKADLQLGKDGYYWEIRVTRPNTVSTWRGSAWFPYEMYDEALMRFEQLETDTDVEDLLREWSDEDIRDDFEVFVADDAEAHADT